MPRSQTVSIVSSPLFGGMNGTFFDDNDSVGHPETVWTETTSIDINYPIRQIVVRYGGVIDGISITYNASRGTQQPVTITHGTSPDDIGLKVDRIDIRENEEIIKIFGKAGLDRLWGYRVCALGFVVKDRGTAELKTFGPYGENGGEHFEVTMNGSFIGFAGYAKNTLKSIGQDQSGGLFGLMFLDLNHHKDSSL